MIEHDVTNASHRAECAECSTVWAELEAISAEARALPLLTPSRDLWSGIEARIDAAEAPAAGAGGPSAAAARTGLGSSGTVTSSPALAKARRRWFALPPVRYAAAAALLVTVTATVTWRIANSPGGLPPVAVMPDAPATDASPADPAAESALAARGIDRAAVLRAAAYEQDFDALDLEIGTLQQLVERRRDELEPGTVAVLEKSLRLIDQAIAESRAALAKDPASQFLAAQLARSYSTKLTLLRSTATMPAGT